MLNMNFKKKKNINHSSRFSKKRPKSKNKVTLKCIVLYKCKNGNRFNVYIKKKCTKGII